MQALYWGSLPLEVCLAVLMYARGLHRRFVFFFSFLVATIFITAIRFGASLSSAAGTRNYFYVYWVSDLGVTIATFLAVYELFFRKLFPAFYKVRFFRYLFATVAVGIFIAGWLIALATPIVTRAVAFLTETRIANLALAMTLMVLLTLMLFLGRQWTNYEFGIAVGYGIIAAASLVSAAMWIRTGYWSLKAGNAISELAWDLACFAWLVAFLRKESDIVILQQPAPALVEQARQTEQNLKEWLVGKRSPED